MSVNTNDPARLNGATVGSDGEKLTAQGFTAAPREVRLERMEHEGVRNDELDTVEHDLRDISF